MTSSPQQSDAAGRNSPGPDFDPRRTEDSSTPAEPNLPVLYQKIADHFAISETSAGDELADNFELADVDMWTADDETDERADDDSAEEIISGRQAADDLMR